MAQSVTATMASTPGSLAGRHPACSRSAAAARRGRTRRRPRGRRRRLQVAGASVDMTASLSSGHRRADRLAVEQRLAVCSWIVGLRAHRSPLDSDRSGNVIVLPTSPLAVSWVFRRLGVEMTSRGIEWAPFWRVPVNASLTTANEHRFGVLGPDPEGIEVQGRAEPTPPLDTCVFRRRPRNTRRARGRTSPPGRRRAPPRSAGQTLLAEWHVAGLSPVAAGRVGRLPLRRVVLGRTDVREWIYVGVGYQPRHVNPCWSCTRCSAGPTDVLGVDLDRPGVGQETPALLECCVATGASRCRRRPWVWLTSTGLASSRRSGSCNGCRQSLVVVVSVGGAEPARRGRGWLLRRRPRGTVGGWQRPGRRGQDHGDRSDYRATHACSSSSQAACLQCLSTSPDGVHARCAG